jgi:hypothetical protein
MSTDTQIKLAGEHGAWNVIPNTSIDIKALAVEDDPRHPNHMDAWLRTTKERASAAAIDKTLYREQHTFIKRTIILSVTDTEDVAK